MNNVIEIIKLLQGDDLAWSDFISKYSPLLFSHLINYYITKKIASAYEFVEETIQETFLRLIKDDFHLLRQFNPERANMHTWLLIIAKSTAINLQKKIIRDGKNINITLKFNTSQHSVPSLDSMIDTCEGSIVDRDKVILKMYYSEQMNIGQIASKLGLSKQTVYNCKSKALNKIRIVYTSSAKSEIKNSYSMPSEESQKPGKHHLDYSEET